MKLCDKELGRAYRKYNKLYFDGALPQDVDVFFSPAEDSYGQVQEEAGGWTLQINPKYSPDHRMWKMVLLHEMAHLAVHPYPSHGAKFQAEMLRLATAGAFKGLW